MTSKNEQATRAPRTTEFVVVETKAQRARKQYTEGGAARKAASRRNNFLIAAAGAAALGLAAYRWYSVRYSAPEDSNTNAAESAPEPGSPN